MSHQNPSTDLEDIAQIGGIELAPATEAIEPFRVTVPQAALDDLKRRLAQTRWPNAQTVGDWSQGVPLLKARTLVEHWRAHVNLPFVFPQEIPPDPTPEEKRAIDGGAIYTTEQSGYFKLQSSKPQTVAYALADSPSGQAAWIYEKFQSWTDNAGQPEDALSIDQMLDDITLYWLTDSAGSSARFYWESARNSPGGGFHVGRIELPMAATIFPRDYYCTPKAWAEALWPNLFYWNEVDRGGHFAAWEQPALFADEMRKAFRSIRAD